MQRCAYREIPIPILWNCHKCHKCLRKNVQDQERDVRMKAWTEC